MKLRQDQTDFLKGSGISISEGALLTAAQTKKMRKEWEKIYIQRFVKNVQGKKIVLHQGDCCNKNYKTNGYNWHIFSYELTPHKVATPDFFKRNEIAEEAVFILWEECDYLGIKINAMLLKKLCFNNLEDLYIFPEKLDWTFVSTHENGWFGPYYSDQNLLKKTI